MNWKIDDELSSPEMKVSKLMVMHSHAGYYVGRGCSEKVDPEEYGTEWLPQPYSRESGYYETEELAQKELDAQSYEVRHCIENNWAKDNNLL